MKKILIYLKSYYSYKTNYWGIVIFIIHYLLITILTLLVTINLIKYVYNYLKYQTKNDFYLLFILLFITIYVYYEFFIVNNTLFNALYPDKIKRIDPLINQVLFCISVATSIIGFVFTLLIMKWLLFTANMDSPLNRKWISVLSFLYILIIFNYVVNVQLLELDGYFQIVVKNPIISLTILGLFGITFFTNKIYSSYFEFIKKSTNKSKAESRFSLYLGIFVGLFISTFIFRVHFGTNWTFILISDMIMILAIVYVLIASLYYGFGESILSRVNIESVYIVHSSGTLIYAYHFIERDKSKDDVIGAFFNCINSLIQEIRYGGIEIERFVLKDKSELVFSIGKHCRIILIVKEYNPIFKDKLSVLISRLQDKEFDITANWSFIDDDADSKFEKLIKEIF